MTEMTVRLGARSYPIYVHRGILKDAHTYMDLNRKVLIVTDTGVPASYAKCIADQCKSARIITVPSGEQAKSFTYLSELCSAMLAESMGRKDCVVAVGGGVVGDLAGFAAAVYMRGIDFYNIPTTTLSQIDSSIGGKTAVNLDGVKNIVGAFHQPRCVLIDPDTLQTLPDRHYKNGLMEALKAGLIGDEKLFSLFENGTYEKEIETILIRSLELKRKIVEADETEQGLRKLLNFGHTLGHGIESAQDLGKLYHGECVALGMLPMITDENLREKTKKIIASMGVNPDTPYDRERVFSALCKDKKAHGSSVTIVRVDRVGAARLEDVELTQLRAFL